MGHNVIHNISTPIPIYNNNNNNIVLRVKSMSQFVLFATTSRCVINELAFVYVRFFFPMETMTILNKEYVLWKT